MASRQLPVILGLWLSVALAHALPLPGPDQAAVQAQSSEQVRTEIPYREGLFVLVSDSQQRLTKTRYRATGRVRITYQDLVITCDEAEYDEATRDGTTSGSTRYTQGQQWFTCSRAEFNLARQTGRFYDASGYTDQQFLIQGKTILKTGRDTYEVERGTLTACLEERPKWGFGVGSGKIHVDQTARLRRVVFRLKGLPVLYFPYMVIPMQNKPRNSGFLPFHTGSSNDKGRQFSIGYFQTLGASVDATFFADYFSLRGVGFGGILRARPNEQTHINIEAYGINDKLNQGGAHLVVDAVTRFNNGIRAVASVNVTTNFLFRQAFSEGFRSATIPQEHSILFATRNIGSFSTNIAFERNEVLFPVRSLVVQRSPGIEFVSLGKSLGRLPLIFYLRSAAEGLSRVDSLIQTPRIVQRLDFHPRLALRMPALAGFSMLASAGVRETYYSARLSKGETPTVIPTPLHRQYVDFQVDVQTPYLEKTFPSSRFGDFKHLIEPQITYRRIHGIRELGETIRFDDEDAIADTNEFEYGITNRIIRTRTSASGVVQDFEFLSFRMAQKYYFDPTFSGALIPGDPNQFYPLNTLSGFASTGVQHKLAPLSLGLRLTPRPGISFDAEADYDQRIHRLRDGSLSFQWQRDRLALAGTYVKTNAVEPSQSESHQLQGQVLYGLQQRGFSAIVTLSYDFRTKALLNSNARLNYAWDCCGVALEYQQFNLGLRTENRITFSFNLKGIGNFGTIKRPESLF